MAWNGYSERGQGSEERGPGGFGAEVPGVVYKDASPQFVPVKVGTGGMQSGRTQLGVPTAGGGDGTVEELVKLGQKFLQPKIEEAKNRKYLEGMQKAASGVALKEIEAEQEWYDRLFGEAPAVEGARAYTVAARAAKFQAEQIARLPELAELPPSQLPERFNAAIQEQMTGDPDTDALLTAELLKVGPELIKQHTKAHYLHLQGVADQSRYSAIRESLSAFNAVHTSNAANLDDLEVAEARVATIMIPPPGVNAERHLEQLAKATVDSLAAGEIKPARFLYDMGMLERFTPQQRDAIRQAAMKAAPAALGKAAAIMYEDLIDLGRTPRTPEQHAARVAELNARASGETGVPLEWGQLIGTDALLRGGLAMAADQERRQAKVDKALAAKVALETEAAVVRHMLDKALSPGGVGFNFQQEVNALLVGNKIKKEDLDTHVAREWAAAPEDTKVRLLGALGGYSNPLIKAQIGEMGNRTLRPGATFEEEGATWVSLRRMYNATPPHQRPAVFPDNLLPVLDNAAKVSGPLILGPDNQPTTKSNAEASFWSSRIAHSRPRASVKDTEVTKAIEEAVDDAMGTSWFGVAAGDLGGRMSATELQAARAFVAGSVADSDGNSAPEEQARRALTRALGNGMISMNGARLVINLNPAEALGDPHPLGSDLNPDDANMYLAEVVQDKVKAADADDSQRLVYRLPNHKGGRRWAVQLNDEKHGGKLVEVTEAEVRAKYLNDLAERERKKQDEAAVRRAIAPKFEASRNAQGQ